jgi:hypothetical protein
MLSAKMEQLGISQRQLSKKCGFKDHKKISNFMKEEKEKRTEINFHSMIMISNILFPEDPYELLNKYALQVQQPINKKSAIEYCSMNRQIETGYKLLETFKDVEQLQEWVPLYKLLFDRVSGKISPEEVNELAFEVKVKSPELKALYRILVAYAFQDQKKYDLCYESFNGVERLIDQATIPYIKHSLAIRHTELAGYICLRVFGDIKTSRKYCKELIQNSLVESGYKGTAYYILGTSYLFENVDKAIFHLECSAESFKQSARKETATFIENYMIPLAYIIHEQFTKVKTTDKSLLAFLNAKTNNTKAAIDYLEEYIEENESTPFTRFVRGLALKSPELLMDSMGMYDATGEMFFINLPRFELIKLGVPKFLVNGIIKYKMKSFEGVDEFEKTYFRNVSSIDSFRYRRKSS